MGPAGRDLLDLCDAVRDAAPMQRAITLLAACRGLPHDDAAALDIETFYTCLLDLCAARYGETLPARTRCVSCGAAADLELPVAALRQSPRPGEASLRAGGFSFRLPRAGDLLDLPADPDDARRLLLGRCMIGPHEWLDDGALDRIAAAMEEAAPHADVSVAHVCDACSATTEAMFDPALFLWAALSHRAELLADEVHALARAYHWSERDILALTPARRRRYLGRLDP